MMIFDFDQTLVDTSSIAHLRRPGQWGSYNRAAAALEPYQGITGLLVELAGAGQQVAIVTSSPIWFQRASFAGISGPWHV